MNAAARFDVLLFPASGWSAALRRWRWLPEACECVREVPGVGMLSPSP